MVELTREVGPNEVEISARVSAGENIRDAGTDVEAGEVCVASGTGISAAHIGVLVSAGIDAGRVRFLDRELEVLLLAMSFSLAGERLTPGNS